MPVRVRSFVDCESNGLELRKESRGLKRRDARRMGVLAEPRSMEHPLKPARSGARPSCYCHRGVVESFVSVRSCWNPTHPR